MKKAVRRNVYLDHAATTPVDAAVQRAMLSFFSSTFANPTALYTAGTQARAAVEQARNIVASFLGAQPDTVVFTGSGTESNNLAIFGTADAFKGPGHIITTPIEHHAVLRPIEELVKKGWSVTYVPIDATGRVKADDVIKAIKPTTALISVMYVNNEIGTIEPIAEIGRQLIRYRKEHGTVYPYFHTDACQAAGYLPIDVEKVHVDLLTLNASKIYGPKGAGVLYVRRGVTLAPQIRGGGQERGLRSGTENVPAIVGLGKAVQVVKEQGPKKQAAIEKLSVLLWKGIKKIVPNATLNGPDFGEYRLPNNVNVTIPGVEAEALLVYFDAQGVSCSVGSACAAEEGGPSHVLTALGVSSDNISASVRFTLGRGTRKADIEYTLKVLHKILPLLKHL